MGKDVSGGIIEVYSAKDLPEPNKPGKPNARYNHYGNKGLKSSRWTGPDGRPILDKHYYHRDDGSHPFPHYHDWENGNRGSWYEKEE